MEAKQSKKDRNAVSVDERMHPVYLAAGSTGKRLACISNEHVYKQTWSLFMPFIYILVTIGNPMRTSNATLFNETISKTIISNVIKDEDVVSFKYIIGLS
jgi:hypothetical protein